jgi:peroxiredoxin Q/BCP
MKSRTLSLALALSALTAVGARAQNPTATAPAAPVAPPLEVGAVAPDFELAGATRYGVLAQPVRLSDYKGKTVVLAFFFKARTKG